MRIQDNSILYGSHTDQTNTEVMYIRIYGIPCITLKNFLTILT
jgi:hypothetical protein